MGVRIAICQVQSSIGNVGQNLDKILNVITQTKADVYIFPEMFLTGYGADYTSLEPEIQYAVDKISLWCIEMDIAIAYGTPTYCEKGVMDSLLFVTHSGTVQYNKIYLAKFGIYSEKELTPGDRPKIGTFKGMKFGLSICYDMFFPEIYRCYAIAGADVNICISASAETSKQFIERILPARSLENVMYTVFVNNIGKYKETRFFGKSRLVGPLGNTLNEADQSDVILCVYVDKAVIENAREERRHLADLRKDISWKI